MMLLQRYTVQIKSPLTVCLESLMLVTLRCTLTLATIMHLILQYKRLFSPDVPELK